MRCLLITTWPGWIASRANCIAWLLSVQLDCRADSADDCSRPGKRFRMTGRLSRIASVRVFFAIDAIRRKIVELRRRFYLIVVNPLAAIWCRVSLQEVQVTSTRTPNNAFEPSG